LKNVLLGSETMPPPQKNPIKPRTQHNTTNTTQHKTKQRKKSEFFSTSKLQDEIKTEKFELNKFHASKKDPFH
jgi:hypothetical protein